MGSAYVFFSIKFPDFQPFNSVKYLKNNFQMSSGESMLSSDPQCVPLSEENLMTLLVNVTSKSNIATATIATVAIVTVTILL